MYRVVPQSGRYTCRSVLTRARETGANAPTLTTSARAQALRLRTIRPNTTRREPRTTGRVCLRGSISIRPGKCLGEHRESRAREVRRPEVRDRASAVFL